jgi:16S rRNA (uracil1498-N3)-methyltransferase
MPGRGSPSSVRLLDSQVKRSSLTLVKVLSPLVRLPSGVTPVSRSERMDWTLQKATELGVRAIAPVMSARSVVRLDDRQAAKKLRHWHAIVAGACEQCGRSVPPAVHPPQELAAYLASAPRDGQRFVLSPSGPASLAGLASVTTKVKLLIGSEGGLDDSELERATQSGYRRCGSATRAAHRDRRNRRTAVLQSLWGDLQ